MTGLRRPLLTITAAVLSAFPYAAMAAEKNRIPIPVPRPVTAAKAAVATAVPLQRVSLPAEPADAGDGPSESSVPSADLESIKRAVEAARRGRQSEAEALQKSIGDPAGRKLVEWLILRSDDNSAGFARYTGFIRANPNWPTVRMFRRRAENHLWHEKLDPATVRAFFAQQKPSTVKGRFALARALLAQGDRTAATYYVREAWRTEPFSAELENEALAAFPGLLTRADHKARMDRMLYAEETGPAQRAAKRLGPAEQAILKARLAVSAKAKNAGALLDAVPKDARDAGYTHSRIQWLRRANKLDEAAQLMLSASRDPNVILDTDEWWVERRLVARMLLDAGKANVAYQIARDAAPPEKENYRAEHEFTAGWIALRFLNNPAVALGHFARVGRGTTNPITLARASYWQGRSADALGRQGEARAHYEAAARYPTAYYGQLARAKVGLETIGLRQPPHLDPAQLAALRKLDVVLAVEILYAIGQRDLVPPIAADLGDRVTDVGALRVIAEIAHRNKDARSVLLLGKAVLSRGVAFDHYAFPTIGMPSYSSLGPEVDKSIVYAIARQESHFNQRTISSAKALGLMQVTPPAGRYIAKRHGVQFDQKRLLSDPVYNTQMGAAELGNLLQDYRGSYILTFVGYNAGRGRVREWIERFGDPREANVDPVDWVERIPFSETRNYVQRVMENMQVYRARFGGGARLLIEADLRRGSGL